MAGVGKLGHVTSLGITCKEIVNYFPNGVFTRGVSLGQPNEPLKWGWVVLSSANPSHTKGSASLEYTLESKSSTGSHELIPRLSLCCFGTWHFTLSEGRDALFCPYT